MAAIDTSYFAADLAAIIADLPASARFGSTDITAAVSELSQGEVLMLTGNNMQRMLRVTFPISALSDASFKPQARLKVKFPNPAVLTNYEIVEIKTSSDLVAYEVLLKSDNRAS